MELMISWLMHACSSIMLVYDCVGGFMGSSHLEILDLYICQIVLIRGMKVRFLIFVWRAVVECCK